MNILIINQPTGNRGDESAHRAFVRSLSAAYKKDNINVIYFGELFESAYPMEVVANNVSYSYIEPFRGRIFIAKNAMLYHLYFLVTSILPQYRKMYKAIRKADYVVCAPGGICMGSFHNWDHIFWLMQAKKLNKPICYYSRSFGPFLDTEKQYIFFNEKSKELLSYFKFLSIRDSKTMLIADSLDIKYVPSIDTAFLEKPAVSVNNIVGQLKDYIVFVPNSLVWQPAYNKTNPSDVDSMYLSIIEILKDKKSDSKIVMMPQLFGQGIRNDYNYFVKIAQASKFNGDIIVLEDKYSSDVQQSVIQGSSLVVGARYHSIVFAINNKIPFVSLSYEHKMFGLLNILGLEDRQIDITGFANGTFDLKKTMQALNEIINHAVDLTAASNTATSLAKDCFEQFQNKYLEK